MVDWKGLKIKKWVFTNTWFNCCSQVVFGFHTAGCYANVIVLLMCKSDHKRDVLL